MWFWVSILLTPLPSSLAQNRLPTMKEIMDAHHKRVEPSSEIPKYHAHYQWRTTGTIAGKKVYESEVPIYEFSNEGYIYIAGKIPIGTPVKLGLQRLFGSRNFFAHEIADSRSSTGKKRVWIDGQHIERASPNPSATEQ